MIIYDALDVVVGTLAKAVGKPEDQLMVVVCLLLNVLLGLILNILVPPITFIRHLFAISFGLLTLPYLYAGTWYHVIFMAYPVYLLMVLLPRKT